MKTEGNRFAYYLTKYCLIVLGCVIYAVGFQFFCYPNAITTGGVVGMAMIINQLTNWSASGNRTESANRESENARN